MLTQQLAEGYISPRLQELSAYYSNRLSYEDVEKLVERVSGAKLLSDQKIGQIVSDKAEKLSQEMQQEVRATLSKTQSYELKVNSKVDIYHPEQKEILLFDDGIQVKGQKAERQAPVKDWGEKRQGTVKTKTPDVVTDVVLLQRATVGFEYIAAPINQLGADLLSLSDVVRAKIIQEYGQETNPLNLVAITDGARAIRQRLLATFGAGVTVILDWYYLCFEATAIDVNDCCR